MASFFKRHWFLLGMAAALAAGYLLPQGGQSLRESSFAIPLLVAVVLGISGFTLDTSRLLAQAKNLWAVLLTLATTYAVAPLAAYALAKAWGAEISGPGSDGA